MKLSLTIQRLLVAGCLCLVAGPSVADQVIHFDELSGYSHSSPTGSYFDGYGAGAPEGTWTSGGAAFNTSEFGPGWSYSNVNDTTTAGFTNQWAAYSGTDVSGDGNYALASAFDPNGAWINLPAARQIRSLFVTNATYPALSMRDGDAFAKKFGGDTGDDPDFFKVTFTGFTGSNATGGTTGQQEFYLADYRFSDNALDYIVDQWVQLDLSGLGAARSIGIALASSDNGPFGMNTPAYVAIDQIQLASIPEPRVILVFAMVVTAGLLSRARRSARDCTAKCQASCQRNTGMACVCGFDT